MIDPTEPTIERRVDQRRAEILERPRLLEAGSLSRWMEGDEFTRKVSSLNGRPAHLGESLRRCDLCDSAPAGNVNGTVARYSRFVLESQSYCDLDHPRARRASAGPPRNLLGS
jgi:hypothetical protein